MPYYLSEPITLKFKLPDSYTGQNVTYTVYDYQSATTVYTGSVYVTGEEQTLYLNDIIYTLMDDYKWFINPVSGKMPRARVWTGLRIQFDNTHNYIVSSILNATRRPNAVDKYQPIDDDVHELVSFNNWGTGVLPRLPKLQTLGTPNLFGAVMIAYSIPVWEDNSNFDLALLDEHLNIATVRTLGSEFINSNSDGCTCYCCGNDFFYSINNYFKGAMQDATGCRLVVYGDNEDPFEDAHELWKFDDEPADYYISWINRYGAWQCQPINAKHELKEKVTTNSIVTLSNETVPYAKSSEFTWTLNTDWLTYDEHDEFESILSSKYVYLYNTKTNEGHYVTVTDSNWTFRNSVNTKKPFNLTLNVTKSYKQTIIF